MNILFMEGNTYQMHAFKGGKIFMKNTWARDRKIKGKREDLRNKCTY